ncbi:MAG: hypothetical protein PHE84_05100 [bacterium]|nr:hypothetical protein [bacterium]
MKKRFVLLSVLLALGSLLLAFSLPSCFRGDPNAILFSPIGVQGQDRDNQPLRPYYYHSNNPGEALVAALFFLPEWKETVACHGKVQDEDGNPVTRTLVVFKRKDWNGAFKVSVIEPDPAGRFSFTLESRCKNWEISVIGPNLGGVKRTLGASSQCPSFDFVVRVLKDPEEIKVFQAQWQEPYIKSLLDLGLEAMSEDEKNKLAGLLNP